MTFLPDIQTLLVFSGACFILFVTPGPDMSLFLAKTVQGGRAAGIAAMLGAMTGALGHTLLAALGLSALLAASTTAFTVVKIAGGLYLLWMAYDALRHGSALNVRAQGPKNRLSLRATWLLGVGINLTNPKVILFFVTFLPQFVTAGDPHAAEKLVFLGLYFIAFSAPLAALMILAADKVIALVKARPRVLRAIDVVFAGVFGLFALKILTTTR
ncbi:LysE family translocator [Salinarimonas ramus]|uniref:Amino acid transporter n=1 Tax=Salinarimonas ramus TaxID=690164 RepID=A0A917V5C9_9HYPH|nr:LysE family translocator [Salinarimonas ramus]GGK42148.1 amino acid transporter [Salinarimonas ramus]